MRTFFRALVIILSGFIGIRKRDSAHQDVKRVHPLTILLTGVFLVLMFVGGILLVVKSIVQ